MTTALDRSIRREEDERKFWDSCILTLLGIGNSMTTSAMAQCANALLAQRRSTFKGQ